MARQLITTPDQFVQAIRNRKMATSPAVTATGRRHGIVTADAYLNELAACVGNGACPAKDFGLNEESWVSHYKEAESRLCYHAPGMEITHVAETKLLDELHAKGVVDKEEHEATTKAFKEATPGACMDFSCVVTTPTEDREEDVLETKGAELDPASPLLWQHMWFQPIGRLVKTIVHTYRRLVAHCAIIDSPAGQDHAQLARFGCLRISHGFKSKTYEFRYRNDDDDWPCGVHVLTFEIMEISLVSVPANPDAIITAWSNDKFFTPAVKAMAKHLNDIRAKSINVPIDLTPPPVAPAAVQPVATTTVNVDTTQLDAALAKAQSLANLTTSSDPDQAAPCRCKTSKQPTPIVTVKSVAELARELVSRCLLAGDQSTLEETLTEIKAAADLLRRQREAAEWQAAYDLVGV